MRRTKRSSHMGHSLKRQRSELVLTAGRNGFGRWTITTTTTTTTSTTTTTNKNIKTMENITTNTTINEHFTTTDNTNNTSTGITVRAEDTRRIALDILAHLAEDMDVGNTREQPAVNDNDDDDDDNNDDDDGDDDDGEQRYSGKNIAEMTIEGKAKWCEEHKEKFEENARRRHNYRKRYYENVEKQKMANKKKANPGRLCVQTTNIKTLNENEKRCAVKHFVKDLRGTGKLTKAKISKWKQKLQNNVNVRIIVEYETNPFQPKIPKDKVNDGPIYNIYLRRDDNRFSKGYQLTNLFEIKKSNIDTAHMGLFAKKKFMAGDVMGVYYGELYKITTPLRSHYAVESKSIGIKIDSGGGVDSHQPFYFGLQFANDPRLTPTSMKKVATRSATKVHNFFVDEDFIAWACQDIYVGDEL
jgi:hypothetical protein